MPILLPLAIALAFIFAGIAILVRGFRGRRIDDHPLCRRCGFDLTGRPSDSKACSECGANLASEKAIVIGHRQRRTGLLRGGLSLLLLGLVIATPIVVGIAATVNWQRIKPLWFLEREADSNVALNRRLAIDEIKRRLAAKELSTSQELAVVANGLSIQENQSLPWEPGWGSIIESAHAIGLLSRHDWQRYGTQAVPRFVLKVRPKVARGDLLPTTVIDGPSRAGESTPLMLHDDSRNTSIFIDDLPLLRDDEGSYSSGGISMSGSGGSTNTRGIDLTPLLTRLENGKHRLRVQNRLAVRESFDDDASQLASAIYDLSAEFELVSADQRNVTVIHDPTLRDRVEAAVTVSKLQLSSGNYPSFEIDLGVGNKPTPVGLAYDIVIVANNREWKGSTVAWRAGQTNAIAGSGFSGRGFPKDVEQVEVILRPCPQAAAQTLDVVEMWDGELTFMNVSIKRAN